MISELLELNTLLLLMIFWLAMPFQGRTLCHFTLELEKENWYKVFHSHLLESLILIFRMWWPGIYQHRIWTTFLRLQDNDQMQNKNVAAANSWK